jgi:hypothetical protein
MSQLSIWDICLKKNEIKEIQKKLWYDQFRESLVLWIPMIGTMPTDLSNNEFKIKENGDQKLKTKLVHEKSFFENYDEDEIKDEIQNFLYS